VLTNGLLIAHDLGGCRGQKCSASAAADHLSARFQIFKIIQTEEPTISVAKLTKSIIDGMDKGVVWDTLCVGFGARRQTRDVHYLLRYRLNGRQKFVSIGRHGAPWTVDSARAEARKLLGLVVTGQVIGGP
jgi:hypothetical protein